ncbi:hypothetical protein BH10PSE7_BH10PSE7_14900 [soil metagenome]
MDEDTRGLVLFEQDFAVLWRKRQRLFHPVIFEFLPVVGHGLGGDYLESPPFEEWASRYAGLGINAANRELVRRKFNLLKEGGSNATMLIG